jgi:uncharacterized lipoprotein YehR (DUF1307 family)
MEVDYSKLKPEAIFTLKIDLEDLEDMKMMHGKSTEECVDQYLSLLKEEILVSLKEGW